MIPEGIFKPDWRGEDMENSFERSECVWGFTENSFKVADRRGRGKLCSV